MNDAVHRRLGVPETRLTDHCAHDGVLVNEHARTVREMTPHGDDREHGGGVALLRPLLKKIHPPVVEVTSPSSGLEEVVHLGFHRFDHCPDDVDAGLLTCGGHVLCLFCGWFRHEHRVRITTRDAESHSHNSHFHSVGFPNGSLIRLGYMRWLQRLGLHKGSQPRIWWVQRVHIHKTHQTRHLGRPQALHQAQQTSLVGMSQERLAIRKEPGPYRPLHCYHMENMTEGSSVSADQAHVHGEVCVYSCFKIFGDPANS